MAEKDLSINLLPKKEDSFLTQFLDWALTIGRLLIILTEIVALGTFLYRFTLDMQLVDFHDKIKNDSFILINFKNAEDTFRDIQARLASVKQYNAVANTTGNVFADIIKMGQGKVTFKDLSVSTQLATISLQAATGKAVKQFVDALKNDPSVTSVVVDKVDANPSSATISVDITATLKPSLFAVQNQQTNNTNNTIQSLLNSQ